MVERNLRADPVFMQRFGLDPDFRSGVVEADRVVPELAVVPVARALRREDLALQKALVVKPAELPPAPLKPEVVQLAAPEVRYYRGSMHNTAGVSWGTLRAVSGYYRTGSY